MLHEPLVEAHPSGAGMYLVPPVGVTYTIWRDNVKKNASEMVQVATGYADAYRRYLDWDVPIGKPVTYRFEWEGRAASFTLTADPRGSYSATEDGELMEDAPNPRDALVVFYATRLAQLVRRGKLLVHLKAGQTESNHARKFSVRSQYHFEEAELPIVVLDYTGGNMQGMDLGHTVTQAEFRIDVEAVATTREERDSLRQALTGLWFDTEYFLEDVGCIETQITNMTNETLTQEPPFYAVSFSITGDFSVYQHHLAQTWEMLPTLEWSAPSS